MVTNSNMISVRNLVESDLGTPLRKFTGILDSITKDDKVAASGNKYSVASWNFKDVEPIETTEPYNFPIATITYMLSNKKKSQFGILADSAAVILDMQYTKEQLDPSNPAFIHPSKRADVDTAIGKRFGLVMQDGEEGRPTAPMIWDSRKKDEKNPKGQEVANPTWVVYSIEGIGAIGGANPNEVAYKLLDGKTSQQFKALAIVDAAIKTDPALQAMIAAPESAPTAFVNIAVASGQFTKDANGIYHKVVKV